MNNSNKKYVVTLLIILVAVAVYIIKDDGSYSKSVNVDPETKLATEYYGETGCSSVIADLNIRTNEKDKKQGEQPTSYELSCDPKNDAIKTITGSASGKVTFKVTMSNFRGNSTFTCKKGGSSQTYEVITKGQKTTLKIEPTTAFYLAKEKGSSEQIKCAKISDKENAYMQIEIDEFEGGLQGAVTNPIVSVDNSINVDNFKTENVATNEYQQSKDEKMEQDNPYVDTSTKVVQRNKYLLDNTADYTDNKDYARTWNFFYDNKNPEIEDYMSAPANRKYSGEVEGDIDSQDAKVVNIKRGDGVSISGNINLVCNYNLSASDIKNILTYNLQDTYKNDGSGQLTNYYYDKNNTNYFYASKEEKIEEKYDWHINLGGNSTEKTYSGSASCTRACEEIVKVEYGPPIAIKAGMCFEYRVKVASIVNCGVKDGSLKIDDVNTTAPGVCRPIPYCWSNAYQEEMKIAGPTEDFQACVKDCDGGKYSESCSNKCYEEVYGQNNSKINSKSNINPSFINSYQKNCVDGMYFRTGGSINWCVFNFQMDGLIVKAPGDGSMYTSEPLRARAAIYYHNTQYSWPSYSTEYQVSSRNYISNSAGIIRGRYSQNGSGIEECHDSCYWKSNGCDGKYMEFNYKYYQDKCNSGTVGKSCKTDTKCKTYEKLTGIPLKDENGNDFIICSSDDLKNAEKIYNSRKQEKVIEKCQAATSCHKTLSEYRIDYNVPLKEQKVETIENKSTLQNGHDRSDKPTDKETILSYGGCYAHNDVNNRWYQSEWTIPGTYIKLKGNKVSYDVPKEEKNMWSYQRGRICLPGDIKEINSEWAKTFYSATEQINTTDQNPTMTASFNNKFDQRFISSATSNNQSSYPVNGSYNDGTDEYSGYNIFANSNNFGHYKWHFTISCFYAFTKKLPDPPTTVCNDGCTTNPQDKCDECKKPKDDTETGYTIRSFDTDDALLVGKGIQKKKLDTVKERNNIPFNWSSAATMKYMIAGGYNTDPNQTVLKKIETTDTFSSSNLDIEIKLTSDQLTRIREYNKANSKPTDQYIYNGSYNSENGVIYYISSFLSDSQYMTKRGTTSRACNNKSCR